MQTKQKKKKHSHAREESGHARPRLSVGHLTEKTAARHPNPRSIKREAVLRSSGGKKRRRRSEAAERKARKANAPAQQGKK
jgi:hypothetical protein